VYYRSGFSAAFGEGACVTLNEVRGPRLRAAARHKQLLVEFSLDELVGGAVTRIDHDNLMMFGNQMDHHRFIL